MGAIFKIPAIIVYVIGGFWGLFVCLGIIADRLGFIAAMIAFFILPFTLYLAPWYAAFGQGDWFPLILIYGTTIVTGVLFGIGSAIDRD